MLFSLCIFLLSIPHLMLDPRRARMVLPLVLLSAGTAACAGGTLLSIALAWGLADLALLGLDLVELPIEEVPAAVRRAWARLASTLALVMAAALAVKPGGDLVGASLRGPALQMAMLAAVLRLGAYPLPGAVRRRWEGVLFSLCAGGYLWLRLCTLVGGPVQGSAALVVAGALTCMITAVIAAFSSQPTLPYLVLHGIAVALLAPLLGGRFGYGISLLAVVNLVLSFTVVYASEALRLLPASEGRARWPALVGLASLAGAPLTLGFIVHWTILAMCWVSGAYRALLLIAVSFVLVAAPAWRQILGGRSTEDSTSEVIWIGRGGAAVLALLLIVMGVAPQLLGQAGSLPVVLPSLAEIWVYGNQSVPLLAAAVLLPLLGGYIIHRLSVGSTTDPAPGLFVLLDAQWLYGLVEVALDSVRRFIEVTSFAIGRTLYLGWTLGWGLFFILYLLQE